MTITVSPNASSRDTAPLADNGMDLFLLLQRLKGQDLFGDFGRGGHVETEFCELVRKAEGENISYGKAVRIDQININQLGLRDVSQLDAYKMDQDGNMSLVVSERFGPTGLAVEDNKDFSHLISPEAFLVDMDNDVKSFSQDHRTGDVNINSMLNDEPVAMTIQRVEVNGLTQGYYVAGEGEPFGVYLDTNALDFSKMSPEIRDQLMQAEPIQAAQPAAPTTEPAGLEATTDTAIALGMGARPR